MAIKKGIIVACFGDRRKEINGLLYNIRCFDVNLPVLLITDFLKNAEVKYVADDQKVLVEYIRGHWQGQPRRGIRNSNFFKLKYAMKSYFETSLLLDDDMRIVSHQFEQGFFMCSKFGVCVPMNPRIFVEMNALGEDTDERDRLDVVKYKTMTAVNFSPMFVNRKHDHANRFIHNLMRYLEKRTCRGTLAFSKTMIQSKFTPLILPENWCVGRNNAEFWRDYGFMYRDKRYEVEPIMLHFGQPEVRDAFSNERYQSILYADKI